MTYLSINADSKTRKGVKKGYLTGINYFAPAWSAGTGFNFCGFATKECINGCLNTSGQAGVFPSIIKSRIAKTRAYVADPKSFVDGMRKAIGRLEWDAALKGLTPCVRINGTSDVPKLAQRLAKERPNVQFYDYTKIPRAWERTLDNYHLTFSFSGENLAESLESLENGINVAVVFQGELPATWHGYPVINGDESDLRFLDPVGVIVGLKAKGRARQMAAGGFVQIGG